MMWLALIVLSIGRAANCEGGEFSALSMADLVRKGAAVFSRLLDPNSSALRFPTFYKLKQEMTAGGVDAGRNEFIPALLKLMGVDYRKINDFALDGIISLLHLISQVLVKDRERRRRRGRRVPKDFPSLHFILGQPQVVDLLKDMQNPDLVDLILKESSQKLNHVAEENVECIHLLICKTKPFVRGMQRSLRFFMKRDNLRTSGEEETCRGERREEGCGAEEEWEKASLERRMFFFVPSLREVIEEGDHCDRLFPNCVY